MHVDFNSSEGASLGVELEVSIVDLATRELSTAACELIAALGTAAGEASGGEHPKVKHELFQCTLELVTGICATASEAHADLQGSLDAVRAEAARRDLGIMSAGTHPFSHWRDQQISPQDRYHDLIDRIQWPARRLATYGTHFHVGVRGPGKVVPINNSLAAHLPLFLALSAASPYWHGLDSGMASCRTKVFESLPTAGLPPPLRDWQDFEQLMETLIAAEAITSIREVWWDVRPHPDFGTVELRMCDAMPTLTEVVALAALAQCLVADLDVRLDRGERLPGAREWVVRQNKWLASRFGIDADLIVDDSGARRPTRELVDELVERLTPMAQHLGCTDELQYVRTMAHDGPSYLRQRRIIDDGGSLVDVVDTLVRELATGDTTA